jgi:hypothetical protein
LYCTSWGTGRIPTLRLLLQHSTLSPYSLNTNLCRAPPLASNYLSSFYEVSGSIYSPMGSVAARGGNCRRDGAAVPGNEVWSYLRCGWPCDFHRLRSCVRDLVPEVVRRWLWVDLLSEGGAAEPLGATGHGPSCLLLWIVLKWVDEVLDAVPRWLFTSLWVHGSK